MVIGAAVATVARSQNFYRAILGIFTGVRAAATRLPGQREVLSRAARDLTLCPGSRAFVFRAAQDRARLEGRRAKARSR